MKCCIIHNNIILILKNHIYFLKYDEKWTFLTGILKSSTPWCISIGFGYQLAIPSRQEAKQRRRKNKSTKISVWFKVKEVLEKQQWEDHRVCSQSRNWVIIRYVLVILNSQYKKDWKGGHNFCLKIHDKLDLMLLFLARLNERSYIFLFSYKTIRWVLMF